MSKCVVCKEMLAHCENNGCDCQLIAAFCTHKAVFLHTYEREYCDNHIEELWDSIKRCDSIASPAVREWLQKNEIGFYFWPHHRFSTDGGQLKAVQLPVYGESTIIFFDNIIHDKQRDQTLDSLVANMLQWLMENSPQTVAPC